MHFPLQIYLLLGYAGILLAVPQGHLQQQQQQQELNLEQEQTAPAAALDSTLSPEEALNYQGLGRYENIVHSTVEILPVISKVFAELSPEVAAIRSGDAFDPKTLGNIVMAFIPVTRQVLLSTAKAQGKKVRPEVLDRLEAVEKTIPAAFTIMDNVRKTDFYGIGEDYSYYDRKSGDSARREGQSKPSTVADNPNRFSGSIVRMPNQRPYFINHPPKSLWETQ